MEQMPENTTETAMSSMRPSNEGGNSSKNEPKKDQELSTSQRFIKLKRDLNTMVLNIQAAAEAREVQWRMETGKKHSSRQDLREDHSISSVDKIKVISKGWLTAKEKVTPQEMQAMLIHLQQLCAELITDKEKIVDVFQQHLKARDDSFIIDLKKQSEELQLMSERMTEQNNTLTQAYREELEQWMETVKKEEEIKRSEEKSVWENCVKNLSDTEVEKLLKRQQAVEEYTAEVYNMIFEGSDYFHKIRNKEIAAYQSLELEKYQAESEGVFMEQKIKMLKDESEKLKADYTQLRAKTSSLKLEIKNLSANEQTGKRRTEDQITKHLRELNRKAQDYEHIQKKIIHHALADTITFENMWLTVDAEAKEIMERALYADSVISKHVLHLPWECPNLSFTDIGKRMEKRHIISQTSQCNQDPVIASQADAVNRDVGIEGLYDDSKFETEVGSTTEKGMVTPRTVKRLMELLCDESGFLLEAKIVKLLDTLEENEQTPVKIGYIFNTLGIEEKDVPALVEFLYSYGQQCPKESEYIDSEKSLPSHSSDEVESSSRATDTSDHIDQNDVLHALNCFLGRQRRNTDFTDQWSVQSIEAYDMSKMETYWESMSNIIPPEKLKIWKVLTRKLEMHLTVLSEMSELNMEIQSLQQENTELQMVCMLLQQVCLDQPLSLSPNIMQLDLE